MAADGDLRSRQFARSIPVVSTYVTTPVFDSSRPLLPPERLISKRNKKKTTHFRGDSSNNSKDDKSTEIISNVVYALVVLLWVVVFALYSFCFKVRVSTFCRTMCRSAMYFFNCFVC
jgi:hypothetical protein